MANDYEGLTQSSVDLINDTKAMMADLRKKTEERRDEVAKELSEFRQEHAGRAAKLRQELESETSNRLDRFAKEDKERAAHVAEIFNQAGKLVQGFSDEAFGRAQACMKFLATTKAARNSAPFRNGKAEPAEPAKKAAAPAPGQDHAKASAAKKKKR